MHFNMDNFMKMTFYESCFYNCAHRYFQRYFSQVYTYWPIATVLQQKIVEVLKRSS